MKLASRLTNLGIELSLHDGDGLTPLKPAADADQKNPHGSYVYAHMDSSGKIFYVGEGEGRRAWSTDRHPLWHRYVEKHLGGNYQVRILQDNLSAGKAEELEAAWIAQCSEDLVNWMNMGRAFDFEALERYHKRRDANRSLIQQAKNTEKSDLVQAVNMYVQAIEAIPGYALINYEKGLVGQLIAEETEELGRFGEIEALDRLTLCLIRLGRSAEAVQHASSYFARYPRDRQMAASQRIAKRIEKALAARTRAGQARTDQPVQNQTEKGADGDNRRRERTYAVDERKPECPYCHATLSKIPDRKTKCRKCGAFMYALTRPQDGARVLATETDAEKIRADQAILAGTTEPKFSERDVQRERARLEVERGTRPSDDEVTLALLDWQAEREAKARNWYSYAMTQDLKGDFFARRWKLEQALGQYIYVCILELNGAEDAGECDLDIPFNLEYATSIPLTRGRVRKISAKLGVTNEELRSIFRDKYTRRGAYPLSEDECWARLERALQQ